ncbi:hypothetical protein RIF29_33992 [Crotalaria pallida]|uniref:Dirigent protein n=1 Tax=Crotalaria pallida TaxID=3830 RepID=A0AAN9E8G1_CROPI
MAKFFSTLFLPLTLTFLFSSLVTAKPTSYSQRISPTSLGFHEEKLTHLHFYFHDVVSGPNPTMLILTNPPKSKIGLPFGTVVAIEDPLTLGPEPDSKVIGTAQGIYTSVCKDEMQLMMVMTFAFTEGEFNGSTLSVLGRNLIEIPVREMPIIGGTGAFRFARGYAQTNFEFIDFSKGDAIVEYNVYVSHYSTAYSAPTKSFDDDGLKYMVDPLLNQRSAN